MEGWGRGVNIECHTVGAPRCHLYKELVPLRVVSASSLLEVERAPVFSDWPFTVYDFEWLRRSEKTETVSAAPRGRGVGGDN